MEVWRFGQRARLRLRTPRSRGRGRGGTRTRLRSALLRLDHLLHHAGLQLLDHRIDASDLDGCPDRSLSAENPVGSLAAPVNRQREVEGVGRVRQLSRGPC